VPPSDLATVVVPAQERAAAVALHLLATSGVKLGTGIKCSPSQTKFNWSDYQKVSNIQDQKTCGDCWAFAAIGAYEASYLIQASSASPATLPGTGTSEQEALDCASPAAYSCAGGWHDRVLDRLVNPGMSTRAQYPYLDRQQNACFSFPKQYSASTWKFVAGATVPSDGDLKTALCQHGPLVAAVDARGWDDSSDGNVYDYWISNPKFKQLFPDGVYRKSKANKPGLTMDNLTTDDIDHDIVVVGWDDSLGAWIIKNSWGPDWGDHGYMKLAYGTANLGFNAAWILANPPTGSANAKAMTPVLLQSLKSLQELKTNAIN